MGNDLRNRGLNMCKGFSYIDTLDADDPRIPLYKQQQEERGFDNSELWSLDITIANFILPDRKSVV